MGAAGFTTVEETTGVAFPHKDKRLVNLLCYEHCLRRHIPYPTTNNCPLSRYYLYSYLLRQHLSLRKRKDSALQSIFQRPLAPRDPPSQQRNTRRNILSINWIFASCGTRFCVLVLHGFALSLMLTKPERPLRTAHRTLPRPATALRQGEPTLAIISSKLPECARINNASTQK